jgi:hypothetical protein
LVGSTCTAAGITARGHAPSLILCRELIACGVDPDRALEIFRGTTLAVRIKSIGEGAKLTVRETATDGPRFVRWKPFPSRDGRAPKRQTGEGAAGHRGGQ